MVSRLKNNPKMIGLFSLALVVVLAVMVILPISVLADGKVVNAPLQKNGGGLSANWAGYVIPVSTNETVTAVSGSWTVPEVTGSGYSAIWVGMDGYNSHSAEQIGTAQNITDGKAQYYAWYEMYPNPPQKVNQPVKAGDTITASVQYSDGSFILTIQDNNWPAAFNVTDTPGYTTQRNSAEWIIEAPATERGILSLADFDSIIISHMQSTINGETGTASNWQPVAVNMGNSAGEVIVQTSSLNIDGSFVESYLAVNSSEPDSSFTKSDGKGHNSSLHGDSKSNSGRHLGWSKGKKVGWGGESTPPGR